MVIKYLLINRESLTKTRVQLTRIYKNDATSKPRISDRSKRYSSGTRIKNVGDVFQQILNLLTL